MYCIIDIETGKMEFKDVKPLTDMQISVLTDLFRKYIENEYMNTKNSGILPVNEDKNT